MGEQRSAAAQHSTAQHSTAQHSTATNSVWKDLCAMLDHPLSCCSSYRQATHLFWRWFMNFSKASFSALLNCSFFWKACVRTVSNCTFISNRADTMSLSCRATLHRSMFHLHLMLAVWGMEPVVTHQASWLDSIGVCGEQQTI